MINLSMAILLVLGMVGTLPGGKMGRPLAQADGPAPNKGCVRKGRTDEDRTQSKARQAAPSAKRLSALTPPSTKKPALAEAKADRKPRVYGELIHAY